MWSKVLRTLSQALLAALLTVSACASNPETPQLHPQAALLAVEPKPVMPPEAVESDQASIAHDIAIEVWGDRGWQAVARLCRWHVEMGMKGVECPPPPEEPPRSPPLPG